MSEFTGRSRSKGKRSQQKSVATRKRTGSRSNLRQSKKHESNQAIFAIKDVSNTARVWKVGTSSFGKWVFDFLHSGRILSLPLFGIVLFTALDFLILLHFADANDSLFFTSQPVAFEDPRRAGAESLKKYVLALVYMLTIFLSIIHLKEVTHYFKNNLHLLLLPLILIVGVLYSVNPTKVVTNTILIGISLLVSTLFFCVNTRKNRLQNFYFTVFIGLLIVHLASTALIFYLQVDLISFVAEDRRYGGFAGNPNTLGSTSVLGIWASVSLIASLRASKKLRLFALSGMFIFFSNLYLSGSGTSMVTVLLIFIVMFWMRILGYFSSRVRIMTTIVVAGFAAIFVLAVFVFVSPGELMIILAESLGKDTTLTGRTELWKIAFSAISDKWMFGWSFDSHESIKANHNYSIEYNHYHNGFLDVLIAGGTILFGYLLFNIAIFVHSFQKAFSRDSSLYPLLIPLVIMLMHNLGEYSMIRPLSVIWQVYITSFVLLTYVEFRTKQKIKMTWRSEYADLVKKMARQTKRKKS